MLRYALLLSAALISAGPTMATMPSNVRGEAQLEQSEHVSIRDEGGTGSAVILIPGLSTSRAVWDDFLPRLKAHHHVLTVQVNGFGNDDPRSNLSPGVLEGIVADVDAYILTRRLNRPAIIGHSMGGLAGMMLAKEHPGHIGRLLVIDALPYVGDSFRQGVTVAQVEPQARAMRDRISSAYGKPHNPAEADALAATLAVTPTARIRIKEWIMGSDPRVAGLSMYEDMTTDLRPDVAGLTVPITLVYPSEGDDLFRSDFGKAPNATYVPVAGAGHFVMLDQPAAFATAMDTFLR